MLAGVLGHLDDTRLRDIVRENPADAPSAGMDLEHHAGRPGPIEAEELLQNLDDELHRREVVIQHDHAEQWRPLDLRSRILEGHALVLFLVRIGHTRSYRTGLHGRLRTPRGNSFIYRDDDAP